MNVHSSNVVGVILAGGRSSRMGGVDKSLLAFQGKPLIAHSIDRFAKQVGSLVINSNAEASDFAAFDLPVIADTMDGYQGPLAGILAAMKWTREHRRDAEWIATIAADTPFFPGDLVKTLSASVDAPKSVAIAHSGGNRHPTFGLWSVELLDELEAFLTDTDIRKVMAFAQKYPVGKPEFVVGADGFDPFFNINTPEDLEFAKAHASGMAERA